MQVSKRSLIVATAASLLAAAGRAFAHGDEKHPAKSGPVKKEQKDWGIAGDAGQAKRSVDVGMADNMRFTPDRIAVKLGETVRFVAKNNGKHDARVRHRHPGRKQEARRTDAQVPQHGTRRALHGPCAAGQDRPDRLDLQPARQLRVRLPDRRPLPGGHGRHDHGERDHEAQSA